MSAPNRWALREAGIATFFKTDTNEAIVTLDTLKLGNVETTGETVYARGGRGNAKIVGFSSNREAKVSLQDAIFDNKAMAMLTGNEVTSGSVEITKYFDGMTDVAGLITIPGSTLSAIVSAHALDADGKTIGDAAAATFVDQDVTIATLTEQMVRVYYTETQADVKTIKVTADKFGGTFKLVVDVLVRNEDTGLDHYAQFVADRVKVEDTFSFNFSPEGDPSVLDIPLEILKSPSSTDMWQLHIYSQVE